MTSILLTPPAAEPLSLAQAKAWLRVEHDDDDDIITALIAAARSHVEGATRRALITQSWRLTLDDWPCDGRIAVRPAPLRELTAARVYDLEGAGHDVDTQAFVIDKANDALIFPAWNMPPPGRDAAGIELDVSAGYGDAADDVPEPLRQAMRLLMAHWYENRGIIVAGTNAALPANITALLAPYRVVTL